MRLALLVGVLVLAPSAAALDVPAPTGRVVDLANVLSPSAEEALTSQLQAHEDRTSNQVVVLTIPSLDGSILEPYATEVFRTWSLGQAGRDNGVLLLVAVGDRELRIEVGYGLEGDLTDATSGSIIRNEIVPHFRDGDYEAGILAGVDAILGSLDGTYEPLVETEDVDLVGLGMVGVLALLFMPLFAFQAVLGGTFSVRAGARFATQTILCSGFMTLFAFTLTQSWLWSGLAFVACCALFVLFGAGLHVLFESVPSLRRWRAHRTRRAEAFRRARARGRSSVVVDGRTYSVPARSSGSSSGGGFSGGGGSSGGGGASGSW